MRAEFNIQTERNRDLLNPFFPRASRFIMSLLDRPSPFFLSEATCTDSLNVFPSFFQDLWDVLILSLPFLFFLFVLASRTSLLVLVPSDHVSKSSQLPFLNIFLKSVSDFRVFDCVCSLFSQCFSEVFHLCSRKSSLALLC